MQNETMFDHERLDVYHVELSFVAWVTSLLKEVKGESMGLHREICDQLDRASLSVLLNTAEGNGKRQGKQRAKFFDDARGSAVECAACLDALVAKGLTGQDRIGEGKAMLLRVVGMLTKLVDRFAEGPYGLHEDAGSVDSPSSPPPPRPSSSSSIPRHFEDEDEDEGRGGGGGPGKGME
jgi:four helix bundle protein